MNKSCRALRYTNRHVLGRQLPITGLRSPRLRLYSSTSTPGSKVGHESENRETQFPQPISLSQALKDRYVAPFQVIYRKLKHSKTNPNQSNSQTEPNPVPEDDKPPMPAKISDAWKLGLQGHHPSQFSRLRSQASSPIRDPEPISSDQDLSSSTLSPDHPIPDSPNATIPPSTKKSLLQTYLDLDKRSQKIISISLFVWSLSGVIYFTWFSPFESSIQANIQTNSPRTSLSVHPGNNTK